MLAAALVLAAPAAALPPRHGVLVPALSLGGVRLGVLPGAVIARWGTSFGICRGCGQPTWYFNLVPFQPQGAGVTFRNGRVDALFTLWAPAGWRTSDGLRVGDPVERIGSIYGRLATRSCLGYDALELVAGGAVTTFFVHGGRVWGFGLSRAPQPCR